MSVKFKAGAVELGSLPDKLSEDADVEVGIWSVPYFKTKILTFTAVDNNLLVDTLYSLDGVNYTAKDSDVSVTTAAPVSKTYTDVYSHIKVKVRAAGAGSQGTLSTVVFGTHF